jgi:dethiobiotin synthetase
LEADPVGLDGGGDRAEVARLSGLGDDRLLHEAYRLVTPASPHLAAAIDGITIDPARLDPPPCRGTLVIEGAGGALVPVTPAAALCRPVRSLGRPGRDRRAHDARHDQPQPDDDRGSACARYRDLGVAFVGDAHADSEATICALGGVKRLGRLPRLDPLTPIRWRRPSRAASSWGTSARDLPVWHPFTQHGLNEPIPLVTRSEGRRCSPPTGAAWSTRSRPGG